MFFQEEIMANKEKEIKKYQFTIEDISESYPVFLEFSCNEELKETEDTNYKMLFIKSMNQIGRIMSTKFADMNEDATQEQLEKIELISGARVYFSILMDEKMTKEDLKLIPRGKAELVCHQIKKKGYEYTFVLSDKVRTKLGM
jgi:hypothetical protein